MSSIQQSFNQMLSSAQFAAGLYAHTYAGQEQAKLRAAKKTAESAGKKTTQAVMSAAKKEAEQDPYITKEAIYTGDFAETLEDAGTKEIAAKKKLFEASPSDKNYDAYIKAKRSLDKFQESKSRYKAEKEMTRKLLENDPNPFGIQRKKMEVDVNV